MNHISQLLVRQVINRENGVEDYQNVFGNSVSSALQVAKELLYDLENPLTPESERSESVRMYREQEKEFYRKFIENLEEISDILDSVTRESVERTLVQSGNTFVKKTSLGGSLDIQI